MKILRDFCVVNRLNEREIEQELIDAVKSNPNRSFDIVLDQVTRTLIKNRLDN